MKEKLLALMQNEGLRSSQLAEMLEINPAGISHILAGRNKPGFDLLQKILRRFPRINPDWLLLDAPNMYREEQNQAAPSAQQGPAATATGAGDLFASAANTPDHAARQNNPAAQPWLRPRLRMSGSKPGTMRLRSRESSSFTKIAPSKVSRPRMR